MIKGNLKIQDCNYINSILLNDEVGTDEEIVNLFMKELNIEKHFALRLVSYRQEALINPLNFDVLDYIQFWNCGVLNIVLGEKNGFNKWNNKRIRTNEK